jgi:hypothetical protein
MESYFLKCPIEHLQIPLEPAADTVGELVNFNVGSTLCKVKSSFHIVTAATAGALIDIGNTATSDARATDILNGGSAIAGAQGGLGETIVCLTKICAANSYITAYNTITGTDAATVATGIVGYIDLEITRYPVIVGDQ